MTAPASRMEKALKKRGVHWLGLKPFSGGGAFNTSSFSFKTNISKTDINKAILLLSECVLVCYEYEYFIC